MGELDEFRTEAARALELNASDGTTLGLIGMYTAWSGEWEQGLEMMDKARQLNPNYPGYYDVVAGTAEFAREHYEMALQKFLKANLPEFPFALIFLSATYTRLGQPDLAARHATALHNLNGADSADTVKAYLSLSFPFLPDFVEEVVRGVEFGAPGRTRVPIT